MDIEFNIKSQKVDIDEHRYCKLLLFVEKWVKVNSYILIR